MLRNSIFGFLSLQMLTGAVLAEPAPAADSLTKLINALDVEKEPGKRLLLVREIAAINSPRAIATLSVELAEETNANALRIEAIKGLEALKHVYANDAIAIAALKAESAVVRARAIEAIGNLRLRDYLPACVRGLSSAEAVVRRSSIDALIQFNDLRSASRALSFVKDPDESVRKSARTGAGLFVVKLSLFILYRR